MNWDITIGHSKQAYGRSIQWIGSQIGNRKLVLSGERSEYSGRLQMRYGMLKHQAFWNLAPNLTASRILGESSNHEMVDSDKKSMTA